MLRPERMQQVSIIVAKDQVPGLLAYAGSKNLFHLIETEDNKIPQGAKRYEALELLARSSTIKSRVTGITAVIKYLPESGLENIDAPVDNLDALSKFLDEETGKLEHSVRELEDAEGKLQITKEQLSELSRFITGLENVGVSLEALAGRGFLTSLIGEASLETIPALEGELHQVTNGDLIFAITNTSEKTQTFLAIFPTTFQDRARQMTTALGTKLSPSLTGLPSDPAKAKEAIELQLSTLESEEKHLEQRRARISEESGPRVGALARLAEILEARTKALAGSSMTEATVLLQAWIPKIQAAKIAEEVSKASGGLANVFFEENRNQTTHMVEESTQDSDSPPPTLVKAPGWTSPLQSVINNFGVPAYSETNPLLFMIFTFPVMYGLMFGDFGEGPLILLLGLFLWRTKRKGASLGDFFQPFVNGAELIVMLGIGTTVFGLVFGDFFGFESSMVFGFKPIFSPTEGEVSVGTVTVPRYMVFTLAFGVFHLLSGMAIGAYNLIRRAELKEAFFGPICTAWFYAAGVFVIAQIALSGFKFSIALQNPLYLPLVFVPLVLSAWKEGGMHAMELFIQSISNTFSYLRIWALNLADFYVKFAIFLALGGPAITPLSLVGAALGNLLVMILEGLIVFVQDLRLHWVEWFGKFYEGTGFPFSPYHEPTVRTVSLNG